MRRAHHPFVHRADHFYCFARRRTTVMTIDTDAHFELAAKYKIASLPTVIAFRNGKQVGKFVGSRTENGVLDFLTSLPVKSL